MRYHGRINYVKCHEWGLNVAQGALFDLLNESSSWAKTHIIDNEVYYWVSRNKVLDELPVVYKKPDTVYRALKILAEKELIIYIKEGVKDLVALTEKGKTWNAKIYSDINPNDGKDSDINPNDGKDSDINPNKLGYKSENKGKNTDINPTDKDTNNKSTNNKNTSEIVGSKKWIADKFDIFYEQYPHKKSKGQAQKTWSNIFLGKADHNKPVDAEALFLKIMGAIKSQAPVILLSEPKYRKYPSSWLNAQAWLDEIVAKNQSNNNQGSNNANHQSANSQHKPNHFDQLREQAASKYGNADHGIRTVSGQPQSSDNPF